MTKKTARPRPAKGGTRAIIPAGVKTIDAVYDILARDLSLPAHFGRNLDALYDALTGDVPGPIEIVVEDRKSLEVALGDKAKRLLRLLADAKVARNDLTLTILSS